ncbi:hypothetical protein PGB90_008890 [Kerria lacca]
MLVKRRVRMIGHNLRHPEMLITVLEGMVEGKNWKGRPRHSYEDQKLKDTGSESNGLRLTDVTIPSHMDLHQAAVLSCNFDLGRGKLYSVKWYKDEFEFFRYMPENKPQIQTFPLIGVNLDLSKSNMTVITLKPLNFNSTGSYRCEVSTDGPNFETVVRNGNMTVIVFPNDKPVIDGIQSWYNVGDYITGNCTSARSNPPAELFWYINHNETTGCHEKAALDFDFNKRKLTA